MSTHFKKGDIVECICDSDAMTSSGIPLIRRDEKYVVARYEDGHVFLSGVNFGHYASRFRLVHSEPVELPHSEPGNILPEPKEIRLVPVTADAPEILKRAAQHIEERAALRDQPGGERSMRATVEAFNAIEGIKLTERQGWLFMALLKAARSANGNHVFDDYEDGAAYFALAGEAAGKSNAPNDE